MTELQKVNRALLGTLMSLEAEAIGLKAELARVDADRQALDNILTARINRSVDVENTLLAIAAGKRAAPTLAECKQLALRLGTPDGWENTEVRHARADATAAPLTDPQIEWLIQEAELGAKVHEADNRKLLWLAMNTKLWKKVPMGGAEGAIFTEIESRLYPEYDGDKITFEEWGWRTPEGDIRYLPNGPDETCRTGDSKK